MFDPANTSPSPQFGTAEYVGTPGELRCHFCKQPTPQQYYRVGGVTACGTCTEIARNQMPQDQHSNYVRALLFGTGAAVLGLIGYATLVIMFQGWTIGYISLGVGYIVGRAMMFGSNGVGGRRYQIAAVLLTYAAVSIAAVPIQLVLSAKHKQTQQEQVEQEQQQFEKEFGHQPSDTRPEPEAAPRSSANQVLGYLVLGLASPFLELMGNPIYGGLGLVILFVGIQFAWRTTAGKTPLEIFGPFDGSAPKPA
jgi:hypothetical protein